MTTRLDLPRALAVLLIACVLAPIPSAAQDEPAEEQLTYQEQIDRFFAGLAEGEYGETFEQLYSGNPWIEQDDLDKVREQFTSLPDLVGTLHHHELMSEQHVTDRFVYVWYVAHFDRSPLSLYFKFYKPTDTWRFYSFEYKEDLGQVARDMALDEVMEE